jgi:2-beta-glucuronyltransferase
MKVVLFSYHYFESKLRAGFHHLAQAYWELGWEVVFVTAPLSPLSRLVRDPRFAHPVRREANRCKPVRDRLTSYVLFTRVHPANLRVSLLNRLVGRLLVELYRRADLDVLEPELATADLVVFESTSAIALAPVVRRLAPHARLVYRVSDDLEILKLNPAVVEAERAALPLFDYVSAPNRYSARKLGAKRDVEYHPHAIAKHLFDEDVRSPYGCGINAVWSGRAGLDLEAVTAAADLRPSWRFHLIGPASGTISRENLIWYGELPYEETIPYLKHADVGLAAYAPAKGRLPRYWADSLKIVQYAYCGLPIIAPSALRSERPRVFYYEPGDVVSIDRALAAAVAAGRRPDLAPALPSWHELATVLAFGECASGGLRDAEGA